MEAIAPMNPTLVQVAQLRMQAVVHRQYGEPDVLAFEEVARPTPGEDEVLVKVHAACATIGDHHVVTGKPYLIRVTPFGGLPRPRHLVPGQCLAGRVEAVGAKVTTFRVGDEVFGQGMTGAFAQYAVIKADVLALKPANASFEEAAAIPWGSTALQGLRDVGELKAGQHVLINGASGGVGSWAVQIAKAMGAKVTAVCSTRNVEFVKSLGADEVIDYTKTDLTVGGARFDLMFDLIGRHSVSACIGVVKPGGTYVASAGDGDWVGPMFRLMGMMVRALFSNRKLKPLMVMTKQENLQALKALVEAGKARPAVEQRYPLAQAGAALTQVGAGHSRGQTVLQIAG